MAIDMLNRYLSCLCAGMLGVEKNCQSHPEVGCGCWRCKISRVDDSVDGKCIEIHH